MRTLYQLQATGLAEIEKAMREDKRAEHRLLMIWLPPYCPELKLIERSWKQLKDLACINKLHHCIEEIVASAEFTLSQRTFQPAACD